MRILVALAVLALGAAHAGADEAVPADGAVRVGVLAYRSKAETAKRWEPLAAYLGRAVPGHAFSIVPLTNPELDQAIDHQQVEFVLAQPGHYIRMTRLYGISSPLVTVVQREGKVALDRFGGVIFTRADRADVAVLADVKEKTVAFPAREGLGGYQMQAYELRRAGVVLDRDIAPLALGQPQDRTVAAVLDGRAEVGFVRTGLLEDMAEEGRLDLSSLKVLGARQFPNFPYLVSTELYPEWPFAAMPQTDQDLARKVAAALLMLPHDQEVARALDISGFTIPGNYRPVDELLRELRLPPYDTLPRFSLKDVWQRYQGGLSVSAVLASLAFAAIAVSLWRTNRSLLAERGRVQEAMDRLAASEAKHRAVLDSLGEGVFGVDELGRCTFVNPRALAMLDLEEDELIGADQHAVFHYRRPDGTPYPHDHCPICHTLRDGVSRMVEDSFLRRDGSHFAVEVAVTPLLLPGGARGAVVAFQDISERQAVLSRLHKLSLVVSQSPESIVITDVHGTIEYVNETFERVTGYTSQELVGRTPGILNSGKNPPERYGELWQTVLGGHVWRGQFINRRKDGSEFVEDVLVAPLTDAAGTITHLVGVKQNITERIQMEAQVERLESSDPLTGLANRRQLLKEVAAVPSGGRGALVLVDLDRFKIHNEAKGLNFGDALLRQVAIRLADLCPPEGRLARLGADEFAFVVFSESGGGDDAACQGALSFAQRVQDGLKAAFSVGAETVELTASQGVTRFLAPADQPEEVLREASMALQHAKEQGGNRIALFSEVMSIRARERFQLESELARALDRDELRLYLQPQVRGDGTVVGAEALIRWQHPARGLLAPGAFIPIAEAGDLIIDIDNWVLDRVCRVLSGTALKDVAFRVAVNISPRHFASRGFEADVLGTLGRWQVPAQRLTLEITEGLFLDNMDEAVAKMERLVAAGLHLSIDDFGTGYSSLAYLKRLPVQELKIDKSFVQDAHIDADNAALVETIMAVAERLKLSVVTEGVETDEQARFLGRHPGVTLQGYLFGMPEEAEAFAKSLEKAEV